jgi:hypothetical protein
MISHHLNRHEALPLLNLLHHQQDLIMAPHQAVQII